MGCAQNRKITMQSKYEVAVNFTSICCGTQENDFLKSFVKKFNKENKIKLTAFEKGGCGREGEYYILFSLNKLDEQLQKKFNTQLEEVVTKANDALKANNSSRGPVHILQQVEPSQMEHCRSEIGAWDYAN